LPIIQICAAPLVALSSSIAAQNERGSARYPSGLASLAARSSPNAPSARLHVYAAPTSG